MHRSRGKGGARAVGLAVESIRIMSVTLKAAQSCYCSNRVLAIYQNSVGIRVNIYFVGNHHQNPSGLKIACQNPTAKKKTWVGNTVAEKFWVSEKGRRHEASRHTNRLRVRGRHIKQSGQAPSTPSTPSARRRPLSHHDHPQPLHDTALDMVEEFSGRE